MSKLISEEEKYKGPRFNVVQKIYENDEGKRYIRDCVNPGEAAVILPVTKEGEVVFVKQLREAIGKVALELPAGMVDEGENPIETARRELQEETGLISKNIEHLISVYPSSGYTSEKIHIYYAKDFEEGNQKLDDTEDIISIEKIPLEKCLELAKENYFEHASQNIAILMYYFKYIQK